MSKYNFTVLYPKGFYAQIKGNYGKNVMTNEQLERCNHKISNILIKHSNNIPDQSVNITLDELFLIFTKIIKKYKEVEKSFLAINEIYNELSKEIAKNLKDTELNLILTNSLKRLDGTKGRTIILPNGGYDTYIPILKETKKHLLFLFNKFVKCPDTDIIIFEDKALFSHLFAIIIHYLQTDDTGRITDCTNLIKMITLLELLLKKKYKPILDSALNNMLLQSPLPFSTLEKNLEKNNDSDSGSDDEWDKDDFEPYLSPELNQKLISEQTPNPIPEPVPTSSLIPNFKVITECCDKSETEDEDEPENWDD